MLLTLFLVKFASYILVKRPNNVLESSPTVLKTRMTLLPVSSPKPLPPKTTVFRATSVEMKNSKITSQDQTLKDLKVLGLAANLAHLNRHNEGSVGLAYRLRMPNWRHVSMFFPFFLCLRRFPLTQPTANQLIQCAVSLPTQPPTPPAGPLPSRLPITRTPPMVTGLPMPSCTPTGEPLPEPQCPLYQALTPYISFTNTGREPHQPLCHRWLCPRPAVN